MEMSRFLRFYDSVDLNDDDDFTVDWDDYDGEDDCSVFLIGD